MGKGGTKGTTLWSKTLPDGRAGCYEFGCWNPATRWIDMERYGIARWLSTSYCDDHGDWQFEDSHHTHRVRVIKG